MLNLILTIVCSAKIWDNILKLSNEQDAIDKDVCKYRIAHPFSFAPV